MNETVINLPLEFCKALAKKLDIVLFPIEYMT
jgi:hypothetical protein